MKHDVYCIKFLPILMLEMLTIVKTQLCKIVNLYSKEVFLRSFLRVLGETVFKTTWCVLEDMNVDRCWRTKLESKRHRFLRSFTHYWNTEYNIRMHALKSSLKSKSKFNGYDHRYVLRIGAWAMDTPIIKSVDNAESYVLSYVDFHIIVPKRLKNGMFRASYIFPSTNHGGCFNSQKETLDISDVR